MLAARPLVVGPMYRHKGNEQRPCSIYSSSPKVKAKAKAKAYSQERRTSSKGRMQLPGNTPGVQRSAELDDSQTNLTDTTTALPEGTSATSSYQSCLYLLPAREPLTFTASHPYTAGPPGPLLISYPRCVGPGRQRLPKETWTPSLGKGKGAARKSQDIAAVTSGSGGVRAPQARHKPPKRSTAGQLYTKGWFRCAGRCAGVPAPAQPRTNKVETHDPSVSNGQPPPRGPPAPLWWAVHRLHC